MSTKQNNPNPLSIAITISLSMLCMVAAGSAWAGDPECDIDPKITHWECYDGTCQFCTPKTITNDPLGEFGNPGVADDVSCTVIVGGSAIFSVTGAGVSKVVTVNHTLEGEFNFAIRCDDSIDTSEVAGRGSFSSSPKPQPTTLAPAFIIR